MTTAAEHISAADLLGLARTMQLARRGLYTTSPNPRVGCVIARPDNNTLMPVAEGWHEWAGEGHAEVQALSRAGANARGATAYVSLEPCAFRGRTPKCTHALIEAGIKRVVAGMLDPHPRVQGQGLAELRQAGIPAVSLDASDQIQVDAESASAAANTVAAIRQLNLGYLHRMNTGRPWLRIKVAASLDGRTAMASGESQWITGPRARRDVQHWRARSCAVVTGIGTVLADDPQLSVRESAFAANGRWRQPLRVILDSQSRCPASARVLEAPGQALICHAGTTAPNPTRESAAPDAQTATAATEPLPQWRRCGDTRVDLAGLLDLLAEWPCNEVLLEAGPTLAGAFLEAGLWDELLLYLAPRFLGASARPLFGCEIGRLEDSIDARIVETRRFGPDLRLRLQKR